MLALNCFSIVSFAGDPSPTKTFLGFHAGLSAPVGKFGSKDFNDSEAGFANNGFHIAAEYGGYFNKNLGISVTFGLRRNAFDINAYNQKGNTKFYEYSGWRTNYLLSNLIWRFPLKKEFGVYLKGGGGVTFNTSATYTSSSSLGSGATTTNEPLITAEALAYGLGSGLKWDLNKVTLGIEAYYLNTRPTFSNGGISGTLNMNAINYSFSLNINFK